MNIPKIGEKLQQEHLDFIAAVSKSCRRTIIQMLKQAQSGHPGGSLSCIDYLTLLYAFVLTQTGEELVVSNGHISPAVYSILAEMGYIPKQDVIDTFRQVGSIYEGHVTRHVKGVFFGTGPLGVGVSAATGFALAEKLKKSQRTVYALMGDGEAQEGQVYEMMHFANKYKLDNFIAFVDYNEVQLTASLEEIMPINLSANFAAANWHVIEVDGHDYQALWNALAEAHQINGKPVVLIAKTVMGKGVPFMEGEGQAKKATWHGKAASPEDSDTILQDLELTNQEQGQLEHIKKIVKWQPDEPDFPVSLSPVEIDTGEPILYGPHDLTDCRSAYGKALLDLGKRNSNVVALTADLGGSVKTEVMGKEIPERHFDVGIAEQNMVSVSGGLSLADFVPFCSTFGAFMTSRAKDQARVNDINDTNVKMVATHCGLSVGEDGPTHQAIDDASSFLGFFNTMVIEPADPNQTDRIIRYIASHWGNFYVRMGRHKFPIITKEDGTPFYGTDYEYDYGRSDIIREGKDLTIVATGALVHEALKAYDEIKQSHPDISIELVANTSIKKFDPILTDSIKKTGKVLTCEDHNNVVGLSSQLAHHLMKENICPQVYENIAVSEYQLSGKAADLYQYANISSNSIKEACLKILHK